MLSAIASDHVQNIRHRGEISGATSIGMCGCYGEGPWVRIWLRVENSRIVEASYDTHGCPSSVAASSMTVALARGRTTQQAELIQPEDVLLVLQGLPDGKEHFAHLAVGALAIAVQKEKQRELIR